MPRELGVSLNERNFVLEALRESVRVDGRQLDAFRDINITFGDEFGVATVGLGKTRYFLFIELLLGWLCSDFELL